MWKSTGWSRGLLLGFLSLWLIDPQVATGAEPFEASIVRVTAARRGPNVVQPWTKASPNDVSGTGFVIDGQRVLTSAHVIEYASQIYVQANSSPDKFEAKVLVSAPEIDLALLTVDDASFFAERAGIPMVDELPKTNSRVNVYGYPVGGDQISVTEGVVSRIDFTRYPYGGVGLRLQVDAALNPGNSGGPVMSDGKLVGVAFQVLRAAENVGYVIPNEEIKTFLDDVQDNRYDGKPQFYGEMQTVDNDALRAHLNLPKGTGGALITRLPGRLTESDLKLGDVITHIGDYVIDQTGRVKVADDLTLPFTYLVPKTAQNEKVRFKVFRAGQNIDIEIPTVRREQQLIPGLLGAYPRYFILGPLVFSTATREYISGVGSRMSTVLMARDSPLLDRVLDEPRFEGEELVIVASPMFAHRLTKGYTQPMAAVVRSINDKPIKNLQHLVELLRDETEEFLVFDFEDRFIGKLVFRRDEIVNATDEILTDNGIRKQYSDDLADVWEKR